MTDGTVSEASYLPLDASLNSQSKKEDVRGRGLIELPHPPSTTTPPQILSRQITLLGI